LTNRRALTAFDARDAHLDEYRLGANGDFPPHPIDAAVVQNVPAVTYRACQRARIGLYGEDKLAATVMTANVTIAFETPSMVKQTRGHTLALLSESWLAL
jgi:hypothetical protein